MQVIAQGVFLTLCLVLMVIHSDGLWEEPVCFGVQRSVAPPSGEKCDGSAAMFPNCAQILNTGHQWINTSLPKDHRCQGLYAFMEMSAVFLCQMFIQVDI